MTPCLLMILGGVAIVLGVIGVLINFLVLVKRADKEEDTMGMFGRAMVIHVICAVLYGGGSLALLGGFLWFLVTVAKSA